MYKRNIYYNIVCAHIMTNKNQVTNGGLPCKQIQKDFRTFNKLTKLNKLTDQMDLITFSNFRCVYLVVRRF